MVRRILRNEEIDDLIDYYLLAYIDSRYYTIFRHNLPSYKLELYDMLNWIMELQDTVRVLRNENIDINSIYAYIYCMVIP